jgi:hypothetical protein
MRIGKRNKIETPNCPVASEASAPAPPPLPCSSEWREYQVASISEAKVHHPAAGPETKAQDRSDFQLRPTRRIPPKQFSNRSVPALDTCAMLQETVSSSACAATAPLLREDIITRWATSFLVPTAESFAHVPASQEQIGESIPVAADLINVLQDRKKDPSGRSWASKSPSPDDSDIDSDDEEAALLRLLGL